MKRLLIASALLALASTVSAQSVTISAEDSEQALDTRTTDVRAKDDALDRFCLKHTGSKIMATRNARTREREKRCIAANGRVYSRSDIDSTGAVELSDALRRLDPSIR